VCDGAIWYECTGRCVFWLSLRPLDEEIAEFQEFLEK